MQRHPEWNWSWLTSWPNGPFEQFCRSKFTESNVNDSTVGIVASYGFLIKPQVIQSFPHLLNAHPSLLPRWRGASPIQRAIMNGDRETGVTIQSVGETFDSGPIWLQERVPLIGHETYDGLALQLADLSAKLLSRVIDEMIPAGHLPTQQPTEGRSKAPKISRADAEIRFAEHTAAQVYALHRAIGHQETLWTRMGDRIIQILEVEVSPQPPTKPPCHGKFLYLQCADGHWIRCSQFRVQGKSHTFNGPTIHAMLSSKS